MMKTALLALAALACVARAQQECADLAHFECPASECSPTCGSDGRTYSTPCHLWFAQCTNATLTKADRGVCAGEVHWDMDACAYKRGTDPQPAVVGPIERDVTDSSDDRTAEPSTEAPRRIDPLAGSGSSDDEKEETTSASGSA